MNDGASAASQLGTRNTSNCTPVIRVKNKDMLIESFMISESARKTMPV